MAGRCRPAADGRAGTRANGHCSPGSTLCNAPAMPVPQLSPPGMLDLHAVLVTLTPALLALGAAGAAAIAGEGRGARLIAGLGLAGALALQALFLLPHGAAAAFTQPLAHGLVKVGYAQSGAALLLGGWACWRWRPGRRADGPTPTTGWCLRTALALALPVAALPLLLLGAERDAGKGAADGAAPPMGRQPRLVIAGVGCLLIAIALGCGLSALAIGAVGGAALMLGSGTASGPWRVPLVLAGLALAMPW